MPNKCPVKIVFFSLQKRQPKLIGPTWDSHLPNKSGLQAFFLGPSISTWGRWSSCDRVSLSGGLVCNPTMTPPPSPKKNPHHDATTVYPTLLGQKFSIFSVCINIDFFFFFFLIGEIDIIKYEMNNFTSKIVLWKFLLTFSWVINIFFQKGERNINTNVLSLFVHLWVWILTLLLHIIS